MCLYVVQRQVLFVLNNHISILYGTYKGTISLAMRCGLAIHGPPA